MHGACVCVCLCLCLCLCLSGRKTMFFLGPKASPIANIVYTELDFRTRPSSEGTYSRPPQVFRKAKTAKHRKYSEPSPRTPLYPH